MIVRFGILILLCISQILLPVMAQEGQGLLSFVRNVTVCDGTEKLLPDFDDTSCSVQALSQVNPQGRILWLQTQIEIPATFIKREKPLALFIGAMASSEIYWNGALLGANGMPGASKATESPGKIDTSFFVPPSLIKPGANKISIRVSSFYNFIPVRRPIHYFYVKDAETIYAPFAFYYLPSFLMAGAFALAILYFGLLSFTQLRSVGTVSIAMMALFASGQLFSETLRGFLSYEYPWQSWRLIAIVFCAAGFGLVMTVYIANRFQQRYFKTITGIALGLIFLSFFAPGFDSKAIFCLLVCSFVSLGAVAQSAVQNISGARITAMTLIVFIGLIFLDGQNFLDRTFFIAAAILVVALFLDQARLMQSMSAAKDELQLRKDQLELALLRRRIAPHFLMNTLNALTEWVESDPKVGVKMISALAEEFRLLSHMSDKDIVRLSDEIALCNRHLEVMSYRVDREFSLVLSGVDENLIIPPGIIHTLIENAFTHVRFANGSEFVLRQDTVDGAVNLTLTTPPGKLPVVNSVGLGGDGLAYVSKRLEATYGSTATMKDGALENGAWQTILSFRARAL